MAITTETTQRR